MPPRAGLAVEPGWQAAVGFARDDGLNPSFILASASASRRQFASKARSVTSFAHDSPQVAGLSGQRRQANHTAGRVGQRHDPWGHAAARTTDGLIAGSPFAP